MAALAMGSRSLAGKMSSGPVSRSVGEETKQGFALVFQGGRRVWSSANAREGRVSSEQRGILMARGSGCGHGGERLLARVAAHEDSHETTIGGDKAALARKGG
jgi:hypothetical protein